MSASRRVVEYTEGDQVFDGLLFRPSGAAGPGPVVMVVHGWEGRSEGQEAFCERLVEAGYSAFAVDLFGKGRRGVTPQECEALMTPFIADRTMLRARLLHQVETVRALPEVDGEAVAAIGFCFGGLCMLDLARAGAPLRGVASFHGLFSPPGLPTVTPIATKVIAFHGWDDPMVPPADVTALAQELTAAGADWQIHAHGGAMHAFMNEGANAPEMGILYNARTAGRAWTALLDFLGEALA